MISSAHYYLKVVSSREHLEVAKASGMHIPRTGIGSLQCLGQTCNHISWLPPTCTLHSGGYRHHVNYIFILTSSNLWVKKNPLIFLSIFCYGLKIHFLNEFWKLSCNPALWTRTPWTSDVDNLLFLCIRHYAVCLIYIDLLIYHSKSTKRKLRFREFKKVFQRNTWVSVRQGLILTSNLKVCNGSVFCVLQRDYAHQEFSISWEDD